jgi:hypothetical protein
MEEILYFSAYLLPRSAGLDTCCNPSRPTIYSPILGAAGYAMCIYNIKTDNDSVLPGMGIGL